MMTFGHSGGSRVLFDPAGSVTAENRRHMMGLYSDLVPGAPDAFEGGFAIFVVPVSTRLMHVPTARRNVVVPSIERTYDVEKEGG